MSAPPFHFHRSLRNIHRRWILIRLIERIALSLLIACIVAMILSFILISRGESSLALTLMCLSAGVFFGGVFGWLTRPKLFDTAVEVDRQLHLADLLATALSIQNQQTMNTDSFDQQWAATILALAETRCAAIADESLVLHRLGAGAWGGVGLFTALVLTIGILSTNPLIPQALGFSPASSAQDESENRSQNVAAHSHMIDPKETPNPESSDRSRMESSADSSSHQNPTAGDSSQKSLAAADHAGAGSARTDEASTAHQPLNGASDGQSSQTGILASGGGRANENGRAGNHNSSGDASLSPNASAAPWAADTWPAAQNRADEEIRSGRIPDAYRDLVQDYFNRNTP